MRGIAPPAHTIDHSTRSNETSKEERPFLRGITPFHLAVRESISEVINVLAKRRKGGPLDIQIRPHHGQQTNMCGTAEEREIERAAELAALARRNKRWESFF